MLAIKKVGRPIGGIPWNKGMKGMYKIKPWKNPMSDETKKKISQTRIKNFEDGLIIPYQLNQPQYNRRGNKSSRWKGGVTSEDQTLRTRVEFKSWRRQVFLLNPNVCKVCKSKENLIAHHIKSFKDFVNLRYDPNNGIILCRKCHPSVHSLGLETMLLIGDNKSIKTCLTCRSIFECNLARAKLAKYCSKTCLYRMRKRK